MDLGCTATVAGRTWLEEFIQGTGAEIQRYSTEPRDFAGFTGEVTRSSKAAILHIIILARCTNMLVQVVDADTPLLLFRPSMAKIQLVVDIHRCTVTSKMTGITHV